MGHRPATPNAARRVRPAGCRTARCRRPVSLATSVSLSTLVAMAALITDEVAVVVELDHVARHQVGRARHARQLGQLELHGPAVIVARDTEDSLGPLPG